MKLPFDYNFIYFLTIYIIVNKFDSRSFLLTIHIAPKKPPSTLRNLCSASTFFSLHPWAWESLIAPWLNSIKPVFTSWETYCQCLSPLMTNIFWSAKYWRNQSPSVWKDLLVWLSNFFVGLSGPTIGVGEHTNIRT